MFSESLWRKLMECSSVFWLLERRQKAPVGTFSMSLWRKLIYEKFFRLVNLISKKGSRRCIELSRLDYRSYEYEYLNVFFVLAVLDQKVWSCSAPLNKFNSSVDTTQSDVSVAPRIINHPPRLWLTYLLLAASGSLLLHQAGEVSGRTRKVVGVSEWFRCWTYGRQFLVLFVCFFLLLLLLLLLQFGLNL